MFSLVNSAVNMTLPAFAAERHAAAPGSNAILPKSYSCRVLAVIGVEIRIDVFLLKTFVLF